MTVNHNLLFCEISTHLSFYQKKTTSRLKHISKSPWNQSCTFKLRSNLSCQSKSHDNMLTRTILLCVQSTHVKNWRSITTTYSPIPREKTHTRKEHSERLHLWWIGHKLEHTKHGSSSSLSLKQKEILPRLCRDLCSRGTWL